MSRPTTHAPDPDPDPDRESPVRVVLAVATYRREALLAGLLPLLDAQAASLARPGSPRDDTTAQDGPPPAPTCTILVVDNDPQASAREAAASVETTTPLRYVHEPTPGLAPARNRMIQEAGEADLLALVDDDEQPEDGWLPALVDTWHATGAAAVTGPVVSVPEGPLDEWLRGTRLFARASHPTGSDRPGLATNNLLLDLAQVRACGLVFDERFSLSGGEDSMFGQDLARRGLRIVWCDEAVVTESVPMSRLTRAWVLTRGRRFGESWARARVLDRPGGVALRGRLALRGAATWAVGAGGALLARMRRDEGARGAAEFRAAGGVGMVRAALGFVHDEYAR